MLLICISHRNSPTFPISNLLNVSHSIIFSKPMKLFMTISLSLITQGPFHYFYMTMNIFLKPKVPFYKSTSINYPVHTVLKVFICKPTYTMFSYLETTKGSRSFVYKIHWILGWSNLERWYSLTQAREETLSCSNLTDGIHLIPPSPLLAVHLKQVPKWVFEAQQLVASLLFMTAPYFGCQQTRKDHETI